MKRERIAVVGGDAAGMSAASRLARTAPDSQVTVFEREQVVSYAACGMPYHLDRRIADPGTLLIRSPTDFRALGVEVRLGQEVVGIDCAAGKLTVCDESGRERSVPYDKLLLATGASAIVPPFAPEGTRNVFTLRRYRDLFVLDGYLRRARARAVTVVGGGYLGIELADVLTRRGISVALTEAEAALMPGSLDGEIAATVADELRGQGVDVRLGERVVELSLQRGRAREVRAEGASWSCDAVIVAVGVRPNTALAQDAGLTVDACGAVIVGGDLRSSTENVWAAGDCATCTHVVTGKRTWVPLGPAANKQGRVAAESIAGRPAHFPGVAGTALVGAFNLELGRTGLSEQEAKTLGFDTISKTITATDRAPYYPGAEPTTVKLVAERASGRLLGGQIVGLSGVSGRTNVIATALCAGLDVERLACLDLGYAPQFAPVWDPLLIAAWQVMGAQASERAVDEANRGLRRRASDRKGQTVAGGRSKSPRARARSLSSA